MGGRRHRPHRRLLRPRPLSLIQVASGHGEAIADQLHPDAGKHRKGAPRVVTARPAALSASTSVSRSQRNFMLMVLRLLRVD